MAKHHHFSKPVYRINAVWVFLLCVCGVGINLTCSRIAEGLHFPLFLDTIGTIVVSMLSGYLPGIIVGIVTNLFKGLYVTDSAYFGILNVLIAVCSSYFIKKKYDKKWYSILLYIFILAIIGGALGGVIDWLLHGWNQSSKYETLILWMQQHTNMNEFGSLVTAEFLIDLIDKIISVPLALFVLRLLPQRWKDHFRLSGWQQTPLSDETRFATERLENRVISVRTKVLLILITASLFIAGLATGISFALYRQATLNEHTNLADGFAALVSTVIDPDSVDAYLEQGEAAEGYQETKDLLYHIRDTYPDLEYVYVYRILEDGCHVVFDLDTDEVEGSAPGDIIEFDESFYPYLDRLLAGQEIEPIVSDDTFGWLLTVYRPVYDANGVCQCYAAVDISMQQVTDYEFDFLVKLMCLFLGFFVLILATGLWLVEYNVILPVNSMALNANKFAYNSDEMLESNVENIRNLKIHTGDEIENLYQSFVKTTEDSMHYVEDIQTKTETISQMQNGLIMVLADMVESRDQCTGDHVRKTAAYTRIIMESMRKKGYYTEQLTEQFMYDVYHSAPLHDVGKIKVPDAILNKPGKLTDEEFEIMKTHTTCGEEVINQAIDIVPDSGYLTEAKNLAAYHHEKWNGAGYPYHLSGEDIPLSARIMAVADVFDALVSKRSYKEPFTFEKAMEIIEEGAGNHFDPKIVDAFLSASDEVRKVAEEFNMDKKINE